MINPYVFGGGGGGGSEPLNANVQLRLHGEDLTDHSLAARTSTPVGSVTIDTATPMMGAGSLVFSSSMLSFAQDTTLDLDANLFCIEFTVRFGTLPSPGSPQCMVSKWIGTGSGQRAYRIEISDGGSGPRFQFLYTIANVETAIIFDPSSAGVTMTTGVGYRLSFDLQSGGTLLAFIEGLAMTPGGSATIPGALDTISGETNVGGLSNSGSVIHALIGAMDEVRKTIGQNCHTGPYTPHGSPFPDV